MDKFSSKVLIFLTMLTNAYRDEEEQEQPMVLELPEDGDFTEDMVAILAAFWMYFQRVCPDMAAEMDLIRFTHLLNSLAIQHCFKDELEGKEAEQ